MRYQPANLLGGFYKDSSKPWSAQDTLNWIPEVAQAPGTRTEAKLRTAPGLKPFVDIGGNPIRGSHNCEGKLFVVSGNRLYQISNAGIAIPIGTVPGTGLVSMSHNQITGGNELVVVNGSAGYVYNTRTMIFQRISDPAFPGSIATDYLDQYILHVEPFGRYWFHSELADALNYNSLDRYESEASPDKIVTLKTNNLEVVVFNETTTEFFDNTGAANNTFQNKRAVIDVGAAGRFAVAKIDRSLIWLANDGVFYYLEGYNGRPISTPPIEQAISGFDWSRCIAKVYESEGHKIAYFTFPGGLTFGYDVVTQLWHRRGSFGMDRWRINSLTNWNRRYIAGDFQNGRLYELDWKYPLEGSQPLVRERTSGVTSDNQNRIFVPYTEVIVGVGQQPVLPVEFPIQPEGPTITGDAPDQILGVPFTYQYTITQGDAPISSVRVFGTTLPEGWTLSSTGLLSGVLNDATPVKLNVRVTDENGLWDEVDDTIRGSALWWLLRTDGGDDQKLWYSNDPRSWPNETIRTPYHQPIIGALSLGDVAIIPTAITKSLVERVTDFNPAGGIATTEVTLPSFDPSDNIDSARDFGDLQILFLRSGNAYYTTQDQGLTWTRRNVADGFVIRDIQRLSSGRWISFRILAGTREFIYSDEEIPLNWVASSFSAPNPMNRYKIACDGKQAWMLGADGLTAYKTVNGSVWTLVVLGISDPENRIADSRAALLVSGKVLFGGQIYGGLNRTLLVGDIASNTWDARTLTGVASVEKLDEASGYIVASGNASGTTSYLYVSTNGSATFQASTLPFSVSPANSGVATAVLK